ncbi:pentapeptide repeat-containing protein [Hyphomonas atlantica]|uniref:Pentapeptide repeat-containing protein n=1 Tax=Hyphomonas atlantica TaxID=1280948 RepID=A0A059EA78_9PROT|nr:pentapeptide repeat-containing protein [Hyphomonas atlantica]KCZ64606.1 hypothetical protein HY36_12235 [Hyphomonas atlantica]
MFDPLNPEFDYRCGPGEDHQRMNAADFTGLDTVQFGVISNLTLTALLSDRLLKRVIFETSSLANCEAQSTTFDSCEFYSVKIDQGNFQDCTFVNCNFNAPGQSPSVISGMNLKGARFIDCDLSRVIFSRCDLSDCEFDNCLMDQTQLSTCEYSRHIAKESWICRFSLRRSIARKVTFASKRLNRAVFDHTHFVECDFSDADCIGASFIGSVFEACDLSNADLGEIDFSRGELIGTDLWGARNIYGAKILDTQLSALASSMGFSIRKDWDDEALF